ncbi:MAG: ABC transporter permease [Paludibacter sp.]|nr:ABC transporter permease [Paludibacter sp.]
MINNIRLAFRTLFRKGSNNGVRIVSLGIGLAVSLVLIAKVCFEQNYEDFYPDNDRIYQIQENYSVSGNEFQGRGWVSGGVAPGMKNEIPQVEAATRFTYFANDAVFYTNDKKRLTGDFILADNCLFDVLPRPMLVGNAKKVLSQPMYVLISKSLAKKFGENPSDIIGQTIQMDEWPENTLVVGGVFEDIPRNSDYRYDVIVSLPSIGKFVGDGSENWLGNDRYSSYVRLTKGTKPEQLTKAIQEMQYRHQDKEEMRKAGFQLYYSLLPISSLHSNSPEVKKMSLLLVLLAFAVILTATLNYILVALSSLVKRSKEMAVHKCYGAGQKEISGIILTETIVFLSISIIIAILLTVIFRETIEDILMAPISSLLSAKVIPWLVLVCAIVFLLVAFIPARAFAKVPISSAFRNSKETRRKWKLALLFLQFIAATFLVTLLVVIAQQYNFMVNDNPGYEYENIVYCYLRGASTIDKQKAIDELGNLPFVEATASCNTLPVLGASGNNVMEQGSDKELFNIADLYEVTADYLGLMKISIVDGQNFERGSADSTKVLISEKMAQKLEGMLNWKDGVVGKSINITEHGMVTIKGVYKNFRIGSVNYDDSRPSALFYGEFPSNYILIRFRQMNQKNIMQVTQILQKILPEKDIVVTPYKAEVVKSYESSRLFRNAVMIGVIVTLIIVLAGLIGYIHDETNRRGAEIAIRKVNGATTSEILQLFLQNILRMSLPALLIGELVAVYSANKWLENFSAKAPVSVWLYISCALFVLIIIVGSVAVTAYRTAIQNPVEALKRD